MTADNNVNGVYKPTIGHRCHWHCDCTGPILVNVDVLFTPAQHGGDHSGADSEACHCGFDERLAIFSSIRRSITIPLRVV